MKTVIMAGGEGARLRPLTCTVPKPMLKLCNRPAVEYILDLLKENGCTEAVFTLRYLGEQIERHFETGRYKGMKLTFSYEDTPLGTAGCVKNAAKNFNEDFLVISGDAMCDFNLSDILAFHKKKHASVTVVTKSVDDPREYGLVCEKGGEIVGFSEKPSYTACISDLANTGIYVLNPSVLDMIPDGNSDFARDVFPELLKNGQKMLSYREQGYWCDIGSFSSYLQCQYDMLDWKVKCEISGKKRRSGIICESDIDERVLRPNCCIGKNVSIGTGSVIEDGTVIGNDVTIGKGVHIHGSVIGSGSIIGADVTCNNAVLGDNVHIKAHTEIYEGAVFGDNASVGCHCLVSMGARIWTNRVIPDYTKVNADMKYGTKVKYSLSDNGFIGETNVDITPDFLLRLGCAIGGISKNAVAVSCDGSYTMKNALVSGITSVGIDVFDLGGGSLPMLIYSSRLLDCECIVHLSVKAETTITLLNRCGLPLTRFQERSLENMLNRGDYNKAEWDRMGRTVDVSAASYFYVSMLSRLAETKTDYHIIPSGSDANFISLIKPVFEKISSKSGENLVVTISPDCTKARFYTEKTGVVSAEKLAMIVVSGIMKNGGDVALPNEFARAADIIGQSLGRKVLRYYASSNDNSDIQARRTAASQPFLYDGAILALTALMTLMREHYSLSDALRTMPVFETETRYIMIDCPPQRVLSKLSDDRSSFSEGIVIEEDNRRVLVRAGRDGKGLFLFSESGSMETSKELCDNVEKLIKKITEQNQ